MPVESSFVSASQTLKCLPREGEKGAERGVEWSKERERKRGSERERERGGGGDRVALLLSRAVMQFSF